MALYRNCRTWENVHSADLGATLVGGNPPERQLQGINYEPHMAQASSLYWD
jgi:hypothetical protein